MTHNNDSHETARNAARDTIKWVMEMVAALELDWDRLDELREERDDLFAEANPWGVADAMPEDYTCHCGIHVHPSAYSTTAEHTDDCPWFELVEWDRANGEELASLQEAAGDCESQDDARERIQDDPLEIRVRSDWYDPASPEDDDDRKPREFFILLSTGGPASRIVGELDEYGQPRRAWIEGQDWFTPWVEYHGEGTDAACLTYAQQFTFVF